jgi:hypothetical protein
MLCMKIFILNLCKVGSIMSQYGRKIRIAVQLLMKVSKIEFKKNQSNNYFFYEVTERQRTVQA